MTTFGEDIRISIKSRAPFIGLESPDEGRVTQLVKDATSELDPKRTYYMWSITKGLMKEVPNQIKNSSIYPFIGESGRAAVDAQPQTMWKLVEGYPDPGKTCCMPIDCLTHIIQIPEEEYAVIFVRDFTPYMALTCENGPRIQRKLRDCYEYLKGTRKTMVFTSSKLALPPELKELFTIIEVPYPTQEELRSIFNAAYNGVQEAAKGDYNKITSIAPLAEQIEADPTLIDKIVS